MTEKGSAESATPQHGDERERDITQREKEMRRREEALHDSEVRYRQLFESTGDAVMLLGPSGFLECNDATLQLFGCQTPAAFISKHPSELSPPCQPDGTDSREAADRRMAQAYQDGIHRFEWLHRREDGTEFMADVLLARVDLNSGSILQAVVRDITERKQVEQALRDAREQLERRVEQRTAELAAANEDLRREVVERRRAEQELALERFLLRTLMEQAPDFIFFKDLHSRFIRISKALADYFGLEDPDEAIGKTDRDFYDTEQAVEFEKAEQEIMRTDELVTDHEEKQLRPDGHVTWLLTNKVPLHSPGGEIMGTFGIARDITRRKEAEEQLQAAMREAEAANRAKSDFLANMSHEIRTPMNAILGMTELVLDTQLTDTQSEYLRMVRDSSESLMNVINDILDFSKVEAGKFELQQTTFDARELFGDTLKSLALRAHDKGLELVCDVRSTVPDWLIGDAGRVRQVIVNLVGNAIKFTDAGEVLLCVDCLSVDEGRALIQCQVCDTGIGIAPDKQESIFHAFEQADNSTTRRYGGTGLGLAICSRLIRAMGGAIEVMSEPGHGSRFQFQLPFQVADSAPAVDCTRSSGIAEGTRVLIVDDNSTNLHILEQMISNWRMLPTTVLCVPAALDTLRDAVGRGEPFDLILTDANMPEHDGFDLAREVQQDARLKNTVIMMLSSGGRPGDISRCQQLGVACFLLKPIKQSELFDAIAQAMGITTPVDVVETIDGEEPLPSLGRLHILLAEDSLVNQKLAVGLLQKFGHQVDVVEDGRLAVEAVRGNHYDLVLMDVQMPEMDGLEAVARIREEESQHGRRTPIVAMTAHAMKGDRERCLAAGMDGYVAKPIRAREMFQTLGEVLAASK